MKPTVVLIAMTLGLAISSPARAQAQACSTYYGYFASNGGGTYYCYGYGAGSPPPPFQSNLVPFVYPELYSLTPGSSIQVQVYVLDVGTGSAEALRNVGVSLTTAPVILTGGHHHDDPTHTSATLSETTCNTGYNGDQCNFTLTATYVSQEEGVFASVSGPWNGTSYMVQYTDLSTIPSNPGLYSFVGQTTAHPSNHYATPTTINGITATLNAWYQTYGSSPLLGLNDAGLIYGGWFDLGPGYGGLLWLCPHQYHGRGTAVDVSGLTSSAQQSNFENICAQNGAEYEYGEPGYTNVHCEWQDSIVRFTESAFCPTASPGSPPPYGY